MPFNAWGFVPESHYGRGRRRSSTSSANIPITLVAGKSIKSSHEGSGSTTEQSSRRRHHSSTTEISAVPPSEELSSAPPPAATWTSPGAVEGGSEELQDIEEDMKSTKLDDIPETEGTALPPSPTDDITEPPAMEGDASQVPTETNHTGTFPSMTDTRAGPPAGGRREPDIDWDAIDRAAKKRHERGKSGATTTKPSSTGDAKTSMRSFWSFRAPSTAPNSRKSGTPSKSKSNSSKTARHPSIEGTEAGAGIEAKSEDDPLSNEKGKKRADTFPLERKSRTKASSSAAEKRPGQKHEPLKRRNTAPPTSSTSSSPRTGAVPSTLSPSTLDVRTISLSIDGQTLDDLLGVPPKSSRRTNSGFSLYAKPKKAAPRQPRSWVTEVAIPKEDDDLPLLSWMNKGGFTWPSEQPEDWDPIEKAPTGVRFDKMDESKRLSKLRLDDRDDLSRWAWERFIDYRRGLNQSRAEEAAAESSEGPGDDIPPAAPEPPDGQRSD